jgi:hypothetical protein
MIIAFAPRMPYNVLKTLDKRSLRDATKADKSHGISKEIFH